MAVSLNTKFAKGATGQTSPFSFVSNAGTTSGTIAANTDRVLVAACSIQGITPTGVSMTWNGTAMTELGSSYVVGSNFTIFLFYLFAPASGANSLAVTWTGGSAQVELGAVCLDSAHQTNAPTDGGNADTGTGTTGSSVVTTNSGDAAVAFGSNNNGTSTSLTAGTQDWLDTSLPQGNFGMGHVLSSGSTATLTWTWTGSQPWGNRKANVPQSGGSTYTLTCAAGSYAITGQAAAFARTVYVLPCAAGSYVITGHNATLGWNGTHATGAVPKRFFHRTMAIKGWFSRYYGPLTTWFYRGWETVASGAYTLTCAAGSYSITGQAASLKRSYVLTCASGSYAITGQAAVLRRGYTLTCAAGSYAITGQAATLKKTFILTCAAGSYTISGQAASLKRSYLLTCSAGSYVITGQAATLTYTPLSGPTYTLTCAAGSYAITGQAATLTRTYVLTCAAGSYAITGQAAALTRSYILPCSAGSYVITGQAASLVRSYVLTCAAGSYAITGQAATLTYTPVSGSYLLTCEPGAYAITGQPATLTYTPLTSGGGGTGQAISAVMVEQFQGRGKRIAGFAIDTPNRPKLPVNLRLKQWEEKQSKRADLPKPVAPPVAYQLTCEAGAYVITGAACTFVVDDHDLEDLVDIALHALDEHDAYSQTLDN